MFSCEELKKQQEINEKEREEEKDKKEREAIHTKFQKTQEIHNNNNYRKSWDSWFKNKISSLKSYIKPILLSTGIIGAGYAAYKMRQAYINNNKQK